MNNESYAGNRSIRLPDDDKAAGADKKAALLLMNLSVREPPTWGTSARKPRDTAESGGLDVRSRRTGDHEGRYQSGIGNRDKEAAGPWSSRYSGGAIKVGSDGASMLDVVPRTKRMRSNSM